MKTRFKILILLVFLSITSGLKSQPMRSNTPIIPLKTANSVLFGKDIIISDQPGQDQRNVAFCSAFKGWLFSVYSYFDIINAVPAFAIMKSIDNGITWSFIFGGGLVAPSDVRFKSVDIAVIGDSVSNLKVVFAGLYSNSPDIDLGYAIVWTINGETGAFEQGLFGQNSIYGISLATDCLWPAYNSHPSSLGFLYSKWSANRDSIIFCSSSNGGISFDSWHVVATTTSRYHKVALAYGRSSSWSSGRYFAAWQEINIATSSLGHIYTSHTNPNFNSPFTLPVNLDSLNPATINKCRNPAVACQVNNIDNDSSNLTEIVLFNKFNSSSQKYDLAGYYNLQAANHSKFKKLTISDSLHNNVQPDINFNPFDSTFMVTYFDSTTQKLPFVTKNYNLVNPNQWNVISTGYNDSSNLTAPYPKVELNFDQQQGANIWTADQIGGNGVAMFDAPYSTWTSISYQNKSDNNEFCRVYPNPCKNSVTIAFELQQPGRIIICLTNVLGQPLGTITDQFYPSGINSKTFDVSKLSMGTYLFIFTNGDNKISGKFSIIR
jgi:hypothetical protein